MNPIIKWPGGKSREIKEIDKLIPKEFDRYIEPFFGGGALFFHLKPERAAINDVSSTLMDFYRLIQEQDEILRELLICYNDSFNNIVNVLKANSNALLRIYRISFNAFVEKELEQELAPIINTLAENINHGFVEHLLLSADEFNEQIKKSVIDKYRRTVNNDKKKPFSENDLIENLITGFTSGYYMYFRKVFNDINLGRIHISEEMHPLQYKVANFYFIREYCYGSMFRYNENGEFNIPYGGKSYNKKDMRTKIDNMFNQETHSTFENTQICCKDFNDFINELKLTENDFMFLDPPYDTDFSDYEGVDFTRRDQLRLASALWDTEAIFILIIKNTDFIYNLYAGNKNFNILGFDKTYTYNVRGRNNRDVEHLIITNLPVN